MRLFNIWCDWNYVFFSILVFSICLFEVFVCHESRKSGTAGFDSFVSLVFI
jgi:hypothetical protein